jgi:hypothetical protein
MFKVSNVNEYSGLVVLVSLQDIIQPTTIVGGCNVSVANLVVDDNNGVEDNECDNLECDASSIFDV